MAQASIGNLLGTNQEAGDKLPQHVMLVDSAGDPVAIGGGTQYTEDNAAAGNPVGNAVILVRKDTPSTLVSADGDNVAQRGTDYGAAYVTLLDTSGNAVSVGGGTQYTEDAAAAANPIGTVPILVRADTPGTVTNTDGDNVAQRGSNYGAAYVTLVDSSGAFQAMGSVSLPSTSLAGSSAVTLDFDSGAGSVPVPVLGIALPGAGGPVAGGTATNPLQVGDAGGSLTVDGTVAATQSGTWNITNVSGTVSLPTGAATAAKQPALGTAGSASADVITVQGVASMTPLQVIDVASTAGGWTPDFKLSTGSGDATVIKGSAGQLGYLQVTNINAAIRYLKVYDKATAPDNADTPKQIFGIPGNTAGAGFALPLGKGVAFANGIGIRLTTGAPSTDANGVAASELIVNYGYK